MSNMLKALVIDDEILAIHLIENMLKETADIEVVGTFEHPTDALKSIKQLEPDIIFLDIEMPDQNGITAAEQILEIDENIDFIFVTAYDQYALDAFRVHATDYLLKPLDKKRLFQAIEKIKRRRKASSTKVHQTMHLNAQFMGNFVLYNKHGQPIKWRTKKVKELCAYLLHHKVTMHRMQIIEDLWPDLSLDKAAAILHTTVYQLRKELKSNEYHDPLLYSDERYSLNIDITYDQIQFSGKIENYIGDDENLLRMIEHAIKGYLGYEDYNWALPYREKNREDCKRFFEEYIRYYNKIKIKPKLWMVILEKLIELDPFGELYYKELIQYHMELGNVRKAFDIYKQLEVLLWEELGEKPNEETVSVLRRQLY
ncbi:two-component SAPR family response regulator [Anaerosolibacter carboniphilus]|uniref:Stage 0 sporulation protein A homolog n=1 Tax=Anaerosolibacter carboniphilus TaxID=1417629 RepID=A0A841KQ07_9FIRM|nr:response regulator [Anaerosolibacter carboniphilus]MBB6215503.1 two-component SAPR family response regulator [Anaerosolibacter carboniphilus]